MSKFEALQRSRDTRLAAKQVGNWCVVKQNDDGRKIIVVKNVSPTAASQIAGAKRDASSDREVGEGWNYLPQSQNAFRGNEIEPVANEYA